MGLGRQQGRSFGHAAGSHLRCHPIGRIRHGHRRQGVGAEQPQRPAMAPSQLQQRQLIALAIDAGQPGHGGFGQARRRQPALHKTLQQGQVRAAFATHPEPEAGGMPAAARAESGANHQIGHLGRGPAWLLRVDRIGSSLLQTRLLQTRLHQIGLLQTGFLQTGRRLQLSPQRSAALLTPANRQARGAAPHQG
jgi:hypothetical protein